MARADGDARPLSRPLGPGAGRDPFLPAKEHLINGSRPAPGPILASSGICSRSLAEGSAYIDLTTNAPYTIRDLAAACRERGADFLDAPVSGRPPTMTVMVGGEMAAVARCRPLLEAIAKNVFHVGPSGAGCVAK